jgi:hypothetical protein
MGVSRHDCGSRSDAGRRHRTQWAAVDRAQGVDLGVDFLGPGGGDAGGQIIATGTPASSRRRPRVAPGPASPGASREHRVSAAR